MDSRVWSLLMVTVSLAACGPRTHTTGPARGEGASTVAVVAVETRTPPAEVPETDLPLVEAMPPARALQPVEEFEGRDVPAGYETEGGGAVRIATSRSKSGVRSLAWNWTKPGASLWIRRPADLALWSQLKGAERNRATLGFWCHRAQPGGGTLRVEFHGTTGMLARCWFFTDYRGWRALGAPWVDLLGTSTQTVTAIRLLAPEGEAKGELHLDRIGLFCDERPNADYQQPWIGVKDGLAKEGELRRSVADYAVGRPWLPAQIATSALPARTLADAATIASRLAGAPVPAPPATKLLPTNRIVQLEASLAKYRIRKHEGVIAGEPIQGAGFHQPPRAIHVSTVYSDLGTLGRAFRETGDPAQRERIRTWARDLAALMLDHGWAPGNRNFGGTEGGYAERNWPGGLFTCREALEGTPEWADMLRQTIWFYCAPNATSETPWGDTDIHLNGSPYFIQAIARLPPGPEQVQLLQIAKRYLDLTYVQDTLIPPDGAAHHHGMFHLAYASYSVPSMAGMARWFEGTSFAVSDDAVARLKAYVKTVAWATHLHETPPNVNGRAGNTLRVDISGTALDLARLRGPLDREMAAIFLAKNTNPKHAAVAELKAQGVAADPLVGHRTLNFTAGSLHRRDGWLASAFGMNSFRRGLEIYGWMDGNNYGRYARHGSLLIQGSGDPCSARASGFREEGWNWCYWPAATSLDRPSHELYDYYAMYGLGGTVLAGGAAVGRDGIWALDVPKGRDISFRKSMFFFDERITVVTTDIASKSGRPAVTTLFQNNVDATNAQTGVGGKGSAQPFRTTVDGHAAWLYDTQRNGYVLPAGHPAVTVSRGAQNWTCMFDRYLKDPKDNPLTKAGTSLRFRHPERETNEAYYRPTTGTFERAWFDHGTNPTNGTCWYTVLVDVPPAEVAKHADAMADPAKAPVRLLQANSAAHVLVDVVAHGIGCAIFEPAAPLVPTIPLVSASHPCVVLLEFAGTDLKVGVACTNPDRKEPVVLRLRGAWQTSVSGERVKANTEGDQTVLETNPDGVMPLEFIVRRS